MLTAYCLRLTTLTEQALLSKTKDVGNVQARMRTKHASCMPHAYTMRTPYSHHACTVRTMHGTPPTPCVPPCTTTPQASFARGGLLLADYINAMSTAMCAVKVSGAAACGRGDGLQPYVPNLQPYAPSLQH